MKIRMFFAVLLILLACGIAEGVTVDDSGLIIFLKMVGVIVSVIIVGWLSKSTNDNGAQETEY